MGRGKRRVFFDAHQSDYDKEKPNTRAHKMTIEPSWKKKKKAESKRLLNTSEKKKENINFVVNNKWVNFALKNQIYYTYCSADKQ